MALHSLQHDGNTLAFDDTGGVGPLIIALPGMGDLRGEYRHLTPYLTQAGYRVVTLDIRGHGDTGAQWTDYSAHAVGRDIIALIDHLGVTEVVLLGNSFAAGAAAWAAHDAPEKISAVAMLGPVVRDPPQPPPFFIKAILEVGFAGPWRVNFWTWYWDTLFPTRKPADHRSYRAHLVANLRENGRMRALKTMIDLSKADTEGILGVPPKPTLIVMGTKDPDFRDPTAEAQWLASRTRGEVMIVEGAGHYPHTEMPEQVAPRLLNFLKGVR
ncbi:alpha/beta hydrolase (plasmid) [Deinococcus taeanensis]|uniref:alpha/beta fold hydrolase n=1 Tax=Deinococcus taeanensis TaxID=2737050 RepID=UPI001CDBCE03|nr:alpha/beta hydrolase [Deinococcus taeanensis]UBV44537.1 alpha/beta hydrolase [Deinococcus taeanensis]